jgi:signal transduction histidine kinase
MVDKLLDISAIESGRVEIDLADTDLHDVVAERVAFFERLAQSRNIGLHLQEGHDELPVRADVERIGTAFDNLLSNALKYTGTGGEVVVACVRRGDEVMVEVRDNGQGLPPEEAAELFRKFRRMSARPEHGEVSSGLGLAIVKRIVDLHGGRVFASSELGRGSRFGFALPLRRASSLV